MDFNKTTYVIDPHNNPAPVFPTFSAPDHKTGLAPDAYKKILGADIVCHIANTNSNFSYIQKGFSIRSGPTFDLKVGIIGFDIVYNPKGIIHGIKDPKDFPYLVLMETNTLRNVNITGDSFLSPIIANSQHNIDGFIGHTPAIANPMGNNGLDFLGSIVKYTDSIVRDIALPTPHDGSAGSFSDNDNNTTKGPGGIQQTTYEWMYEILHDGLVNYKHVAGHDIGGIFRTINKLFTKLITDDGTGDTSRGFHYYFNEASYSIDAFNWSMEIGGKAALDHLNIYPWNNNGVTTKENRTAAMTRFSHLLSNPINSMYQNVNNIVTSLDKYTGSIVGGFGITLESQITQFRALLDIPIWTMYYNIMQSLNSWFWYNYSLFINDDGALPIVMNNLVSSLTRWATWDINYLRMQLGLCFKFLYDNASEIDRDAINFYHLFDYNGLANHMGWMLLGKPKNPHHISFIYSIYGFSRQTIAWITSHYLNTN